MKEENVWEDKMEPYSEKSFVVRGDTRHLRDQLVEFGRWNPKLKGGPGWIFPNSAKSSVKKILDKDAKVKSPEKSRSPSPKKSPKKAPKSPEKSQSD